MFPLKFEGAELQVCIKGVNIGEYNAPYVTEIKCNFDDNRRKNVFSYYLLIKIEANLLACECIVSIR